MYGLFAECILLSLPLDFGVARHTTQHPVRHKLLLLLRVGFTAVVLLPLPLAVTAVPGW
jgi:hypothetical protein